MALVNVDSIDLFDEFGRLIPVGIQAPVHQEVRRYYQLNQTPFDMDQIYRRTTQFLGPAEDISLEEFKTQVQHILDDLGSDHTTKNILKGTLVPFLIPMQASQSIGEIFHSQLMPGLKASYEENFPKYQLIDHSLGQWTKDVKFNPASRQDEMIRHLDQKSQVGVIFPCVSEYSIPAAYEALKTLPKKFSLSGTVALMSALIGSPYLLYNETAYSPLLWASGDINDDKDFGLCAEAYGYNLTINSRPNLEQLAEYWWSCLHLIN